MSRRELVARSAHLDFAALGAEYLERAQRVVGREGRFTDKMPLNYLYCGLIHRALPQAKIVHLMRHPIAACYAMYKTLFKDAYPFSYDLDEIGRYYVSYRRLMDHWQDTLPGTIHCLSYEALVADQIGETRKLLEYCGLEWEDACVDFHRNSAPTTTASAVQVRQPLYQTSVSQWRHYEAQLEPLARQLRAAGFKVGMNMSEAARIEQHTIYPIPANERHGRARDLFTVWFGSNIMILTIVTGSLATLRFHLSLIAAGLAILVGNLVGGIFMALHAAQGPQLGVPQMVQSRGQFGSVGAIFVVALVVFMYLGFVASNLVLGGQSLHSIAGALSDQAGIVLIALLSFVAAAYGYDLIHTYARWMSWICGAALLICFVWIFTVSGLPADVWRRGGVSLSGFLGMVSVGALWQIAYAPYVSDYSRYMPPVSGVWPTFWASYWGCVLGSALPMLLGALLGLERRERQHCVRPYRCHGADQRGHHFGVLGGHRGNHRHERILRRSLEHHRGSDVPPRLAAGSLRTDRAHHHLQPARAHDGAPRREQFHGELREFSHVPPVRHGAVDRGQSSGFLSGSARQLRCAVVFRSGRRNLWPL